MHKMKDKVQNIVWLLKYVRNIIELFIPNGYNAGQGPGV